MCERENELERESVCVRERDWEGEREREREREKEQERERGEGVGFMPRGVWRRGAQECRLKHALSTHAWDPAVFARRIRSSTKMDSPAALPSHLRFR